MTYAQSLAMCERFMQQTCDEDQINWCLEYQGLHDAKDRAGPNDRLQADPAYLRGFERGRAQLAIEAWCEEKGMECAW